MPKLPGVNHLNAVRALEKRAFWLAREGKPRSCKNAFAEQTSPFIAGGIRLIGRCMEDLIISAIYEKEETSPKQATDLREKALSVLHYATTG